MVETNKTVTNGNGQNTTMWKGDSITGHTITSVWPYPTTPPPLIYKKMSEVMKDIGYVGKSQTNTAQGFKFRGIDTFINTLNPALNKHGVFVAPKVVSEWHDLREVTRSTGKPGIDKHVHLQMSYTFYAEDGSSVVIGPIAAEGIDSGDKATNKALSAALKYALIQTFMIPTEDLVDGDSESPTMAASTPKTADVKPAEVKSNTSGGFGKFKPSTPAPSDGGMFG